MKYKQTRDDVIKVLNHKKFNYLCREKNHKKHYNQI
jgi:hypothetical protein